MKRIQHSSLALTALMLAAALLPLTMYTPTTKALTLYDSGNPTPEEQLVLEYINRARPNPVAEGQRLGIDIHEGLSDPSLVGPRPPLAMNKILLGIAEGHSTDMYNNNYFSHNDQSGNTPFDRMTHAGYQYATAGENMAGGAGMSANDLQDFMMVDSGTPGRPHRVNLLDIFPYPCGTSPCIYSEVGVGYVNAPTPNGSGLSSLITEDFGATGSTGPFLLGVVYDDRNGNNFYDIGEGIAGITITPSSGSYYAISSSAGGYTIPIGSSGTITVTASGPGIAPITKTVPLTGTNVKLDFVISSQSGTTTSTSTSTMTSITSTTTATTRLTSSSAHSQSIAFNPVYAPVGSTIQVSGSGFSSSDTACTLSDGNTVSSQTCSISGGTLSGSFQVANVPVGSYSVIATGTPVDDTAAALFTVISPLITQTTSTTTSTMSTSTNTSPRLSNEDFLIASSASVISVTQGENSSVTIQVYSVNGFNSTVALWALWLGDAPANVGLSVPSAVTPNANGAATLPLTITDYSDPSPGTFTVRVIGTSGSLAHTMTPDITVQIIQPVGMNVSTTRVTSSSTSTIAASSTTSTTSETSALASTTSTSSSTTSTLLPVPVNCPVSYATSNSEITPLVHGLRTFRDDSIMKSHIARAFMILFNSWYYSFSPHLTSYLTTRPTQRMLLKYSLYPLIAILYASYFSYSIVLPLGAEVAAVIAGIVGASLLGAIFLAPIGYLASRILRRRLEHTFLQSKHVTLWFVISVILIGVVYFTNYPIMGVVTANMTLSALTLGSILTLSVSRSLKSLKGNLRYSLARIWFFSNILRLKPSAVR